MLVLAFKLQARQMGYFTKEEWLKGFTDLQCDSLTKLVAKLESLRNLLNDVTSFKSIYRYAFDFARVSAFLYSQIITIIQNVLQIKFKLLKSLESCQGRRCEVNWWGKFN